jgi:hypothetical protein
MKDTMSVEEVIEMTKARLIDIEQGDQSGCHAAICFLIRGLTAYLSEELRDDIEIIIAEFDSDMV